MEYSKEFLKKITSTGVLGYPLRKIINVLEVENEKQFIKDFDNPESEIAKAYQKGVDQADFAIDTKLFELAKGGDLKALKMFEDRKAKLLMDEKIDKNSRKKKL